MRSTPLPLATTWFDSSAEPLPPPAAHNPARLSLPRVLRVPHKGPVLHASPMAEHGEVLGLNVARGCVHRCGFCSARAYPNYPGDEVLELFSDTVERLE